MKRLYVISGSSGVGKGTIIKEFLKRNPKYKLSVSSTTRKKRPGEKEGENYYYISKEEFETGITNGEFIEWAEFSGNYYGTRKSTIEDALSRGENLILEIETQGGQQIKKLLPDSVLIFIAPPSFEELKKRLEGRKTEDEATIQKRLSQVEREKESSKEYDYIVVNDEIEKAVKRIEEIISQSAI